MGSSGMPQPFLEDLPPLKISADAMQMRRNASEVTRSVLEVAKDALGSCESSVRPAAMALRNLGELADNLSALPRLAKKDQKTQKGKTKRNQTKIQGSIAERRREAQKEIR